MIISRNKISVSRTSVSMTSVSREFIKKEHDEYIVRIDNSEFISKYFNDKQKEFYKTLLFKREENIIVINQLLCQDICDEIKSYL